MPTSDVDAPDAAAAPVLRVTEIEVKGMCCQSEVALIEKKVGGMKGVTGVKVSLMLRRIAVTHDEQVVSADKILRMLNWSLLGASLVQKGSGSGLQRGSLWTKETLLLAIITVLFGIGCAFWARPKHESVWSYPYTYVCLAVLLVGSPVLLVRAIAGIVYQRALNMQATMTIAVVGAVILLDMWEASAIVFFFAVSEWLQAWCVHHTASAASGLGGLLPETVSRADGGADYPLSDVQVGDTLLVRPGASVPVDGTVESGASSVDESMLTGESMPLLKQLGASVYAGTTNQSGALVVRATKRPDECSAVQLTSMVAQAQRSASRLLLLERFAKVYTAFILLCALLLATVPLGWCQWTDGGLWSGEGHGHGDGEPHAEGLLAQAGYCTWWVRRALALTVISCPCSLVVAMPVTYACGIAFLARWGVLVKSSKQSALRGHAHTHTHTYFVPSPPTTTTCVCPSPTAYPPAFHSRLPLSPSTLASRCAPPPHPCHHRPALSCLAPQWSCSRP